MRIFFKSLILIYFIFPTHSFAGTNIDDVLSSHNDNNKNELIIYTSYTPNNFEEIFLNNFKSNPVTLIGQLFLPEGDGPFPVVILQHGTGNVKNIKKWYKDLSKSLLSNGIGIFINDSYKNRKSHMLLYLSLTVHFVYLCHRRNANKLYSIPFVPPCATIKESRGTPISQ